MQMFTPHIPSDAPFSGDQRAWLGGFLAGLKSHADMVGANGDDAPSKAKPLDILFGTQTGNAEAVAEEAAELACRGLQLLLLLLATGRGLLLFLLVGRRRLDVGGVSERRKDPNRNSHR